MINNNTENYFSVTYHNALSIFVFFLKDMTVSKWMIEFDNSMVSILPLSTESCEGRCDHSDSTTCHCDSECLEFGDCCVDYYTTCDLTLAPNSASETKIEPQFHLCYSIPRLGNFYLVPSCPPTWKEAFIRSRCSLQHDGMPVFDENGYNFRNIFCALCHSRKIRNVQPYRAVEYYPYVCHKSGMFVTQGIPGLFDYGYSFDNFVEFLVGNRFRRCLNSLYDQCPLSSNISVSTFCKSYVLERCVVKDDNIFSVKNLHCAVCNGFDLANLNVFRCDAIILPSASYQNIWQFRSHQMNTPVPSRMCYPGEVFDALMQVCRKTLCRPGFIASYGHCTINNDTNLYVINNWRCVEQDTLLFFKSYSSEYDHRGCLKEKLTRKWLKNAHDQQYSHMVLEDEITWTALKFSKGNVFELLRQIENTTSTQNSKDLFCGVSEIEAFISCDMQSSKDICQENWYSGIHTDFLLVNESKQMIFYVTKTIYIHFSYMIYHENYNFELRQSRRRNVLFVCGHEVRPAFLSCEFIMLKASEFIISYNKSVLKYAGQDIDQDQFLLLPDGNAQICVDVLANNDKKNRKEETWAILINPLDVISYATSCLSLCGLLGTIFCYVKFKRLRNIYGKGVMSLCGALMLAQLFTLLSNMIFLSDMPCVVFAAMTHYCWLATFSWSTLLAGVLFYQFVLKSAKQLDESIKSFLMHQLAGWSVPMIPVATSLFFHFCNCLPSNVTSVYDSSTCWIRAGFVNLIAFGIPVALCLAMNIIFVSFTLIYLRKARQLSNVLQNKSVNEQGWKEVLLFAKVKYNFKMYKVSGQTIGPLYKGFFFGVNP